MIRTTFIGALAVGLGARLAAPAVAQTTPTPMRLADLGYTDAASLPLFAQQGGFFKKYGIDADVTTMNGGGAIIAAIAGGALDGGFSNITTAVAALQRGIPILPLVPAGLNNGGRADSYLVKVRGSKLKTGADLNGKTIAVTTLGGTLELGTSAWIDKNGGDSKTVHYVELPPSSMTPALKAARVDAAMLSEPLVTQNAADVEILADVWPAIAPLWLSSVYVVSKPWATANPDAAKRFVAAMHDAARWANTHHADTAKILAPLANVSLETVNAMGRTTYGETLTRALLQPGIDAAYKYGQLKQPYDTQQIVDAAAPYQPK
jgi:NitT/TauT family transport system substrate-binding protein